MKLKTLASALSAAGLGLALGLAPVPSAAQVTFYTPITHLHDDDLDFVVDNNNNGTIDKGDRIVSVFQIHDTEGIFAGQGPTPSSPPGATFELTGVADVTITSVTGTGTLIFGASGGAGVLSGFVAGTTTALWTDTTPDLQVINSACGTRAQCLALAGLGGTDGSTLFMTFGFFGDVNDYWFSIPGIGGATIGVVQGGSASTSFGTFNTGQDIGINNSGRTFGTQKCDLIVTLAGFCAGGDGRVTAIGNGQILGGEGLIASEWTARSKLDIQLAPIPEPGSLALLGAALASAAGFGRRRKQK